MSREHIYFSIKKRLSPFCLVGNFVITRTCDRLLSKQNVWGHCPKEYRDRDSLYKKLLSVKGFDPGISALERTPELTDRDPEV